MKQEKEIISKIKASLWIVGVFCIAAFLFAIGMTQIHPAMAYGLMALSVVTFLISVFYIRRLCKAISDDILSAGFEQGQVQKSLLKEFPVPYVLTDGKGDILWNNAEFAKLVPDRGDKNNINQLFSQLHKKIFPAKGGIKNVKLNIEEKKYRIEIKNVLVEAINDSAEEQNLMAFYFFNETKLSKFRAESREKSLAAGLIYIDNFDEVLENREEVSQTVLLAVVERRITRYMQDYDAIVKKFDKDKFFFVCKEKNLSRMVESRFSILDDIKTVNTGDGMSLTLSIGVGINPGGYLQAYESSRVAMDLALGRGGDQAVIKDGEYISYYGGKSQKVEKSTKVKARVKAHAIREAILSKDKIFIMGHKNPDADCVGAALGMSCMVKALGKTAYIIMDKKCPAIEPVVERMEEDGLDFSAFITGEQAMTMNTDGSLLILLDNNIPAMTECPQFIKPDSSVVVIDHHRQTNDTVKDTVVTYVEPYASSTCELVSEILQYVPDKPKLKAAEADAMYSGILVDTDNFVIKAGVRTFEAAAYLRRAGANVTRVRKMFREDMDSYRIKGQIMSRAESFMDEFVIAINEGGVPGATVIGARTANSLLDIKGVRGSFVITPISVGVYISARSIDDLNVAIIMERLGGGGHVTMAAAQIKDVDVPQARERLENIIREMKKNGEI